MRVLAVDDDKENLEYLKVLFSNLGHEILLAGKYADGMKLIVDKKPDLVLLDIMLTEKDGISMLQEIKQFDKTIDVVMITAYKDAEKVIDAFRFGAMDCLLKPFNVDYLLYTILPRVKVRPR